MALLAALAVAVATWAAAAAQGRPRALPVLGITLALAVMATAARRRARVLPPGRDVLMLTVVTVVSFVGIYVGGWADRAHHDEIARLLPWAVVVLSTFWPEPKVLRYCLLLAAGALLGSTLTGDPPRWAVGTSLVALAVALVATNRLSAATGPRLGDTAPTTRRRIGTEALALLVVVGLLAALAAALVPPPPGNGGSGDGPGGGRPSLLRPAAAAVDFSDRLDVGAARGPRGDEVVLLVDAPVPDVWRATTYDHWDGERWERSAEALSPVEDLVAPGTGDVASDQGGPGLFQWVTVQARSAPVLVAAPRPTLVGASTPVRQGEDASLYPQRPLGRGERYLVTSTRDPATAGRLRAAEGDVPADVADAYLQLPQVAPGVRALAAEVVAGARSDYDRARALEDWLYDNTTVTDDARPGSLEAFLLDTRAGPPERTATAMAVMLRALGVPARVAVGFLPGTRTGPDREFVVRMRDTHAWVEVWFPGIGWHRFDPTGKAPPPEPQKRSVWDRLRALWPLLAVLALAGLAVLVWWGVRRWRRNAARPWATRFLDRLEREGRARRRPRRPSETPAEYAAGLAGTVLPDPRLAEAGELVTVAAYGRHEPPAEDRARADDVLRRAAKAAPVRRFRARHRPTIREP